MLKMKITVLVENTTKDKRLKTKHGLSIYIEANKQDDFTHEQNLIVTEKGKAALFSGCSHKGIDNIMCSAKKHSPTIHAVFGGFHLYNPVTKTEEPQEAVQRLINELSAYDTVFYTGHCTGSKAFESMRDSMGEKVQYLSTGKIVEI